MSFSKTTEDIRSLSSSDSQELKLESIQKANTPTKEKRTSTNIAVSSQSLIPNSAMNESKLSVSPPIYPTLNSTVTLVNNQNNNQNTILSEDLSIYTNYSDDTYIHENELKSAFKHGEDGNNVGFKPFQHSETDLKGKDKSEYITNLRKVQSVLQYSDHMKPYHYSSYDSLDRTDSNVSVLEPLEIEDEETGNIISKPYPMSKYQSEIGNNRMEREVLTSPIITKDELGKKKYFPAQSFDQIIHPSEMERKDSYYDYEPNEPPNLSSLERKFSDLSLASSSDPSLNIGSHGEFERTRAYSMSAMCPEIGTRNIMGLGSEKESSKTTSTTATGEYPTHPHSHHHHFFVISTSEADMPSPAIVKFNSELIKDSPCSTRTVISRQHRKFDITTTSISSKTPTPSVTSTTKPKTSSSSTNLMKHRRTPSNSSNLSSHSRFTIIREPSSKNVNNEKVPLSATKRPSRFTVTRNAIN